MRRSSKRKSSARYERKSAVQVPKALPFVAQPNPFFRRLAVVVAFAGALRILHLVAVVRTLGEAQIHDAAFYHDWALTILGRQSVPGLGSELPFANVGYPYFVAAAYAVIASPTFVLVLQSIASASATFLVGLLAHHISKRALVGLLAAAVYATYAPSIFYDGLLLIPSLSATLATVLGWALYWTMRHRAFRFAAIAGMAIGLSGLLRASQLLLLLPALAAVWFGAKSLARAKRLQLLLVLALTTCGCVAPVVLLERARTGEWVPLSTNGGMNFWVGNHSGASGKYEDAPFLGSSRGGDFRHTIVVERDRFLAEARRRTGDESLTLARASDFWWGEAWRDIRAAPSAWLALLGRKLAILVNNYEPRTNASIDLMTRISPLLAYNPIRFGPILLLAVVGFLEPCRRRYRRVVWICGTLASAPILTCLGFFVSGEYRHPALPALAYFAAVGAERMWRAARTRNVGTLVVSWYRPLILLAAGIAAFAPTQRIGHAKDRKAYAEALAMPDSNQSPPTSERYARARGLLALHDDSLEDAVLSTEAMLLVESNQAIQFKDKAAAQRLISAVRQLWKRDLVPGREFDASTVERIRWNSVRRVAQLCHQPFVEEWPELHEAFTLLGCGDWLEARFLLERNLVNQAQRFLDRAIEYAPNSVEVMAYMGQLAWLQKRDGTPWMEASVRGSPPIALPAILLSRRAMASADLASARRFAEEALRREPTNVEARALISQLAEADGR